MILRSNIQNAYDAITVINEVHAAGHMIQPSSLNELVDQINYAAVTEQDTACKNWMFLAHWVPQQLPN
jgi:hypothetical protein